MNQSEVTAIVNQTLYDLEQRLGEQFRQGCIIVLETGADRRLVPSAVISSTMTRHETRKCLEAVVHAHKQDHMRGN